MKKFAKYWLPPLAWAVFMFPLCNHYLSQSAFYEFTVSIIKWFFPSSSEETVGVMYIFVRKSFHFFEYAVLAFLLFRGFRAGHRKKWNPSWALYAGAIAIGYGLLDEFVQSLVPVRRCSLFDWGVDAAGVLFALALVAWTSKKRPADSKPVVWKNFLRKGLFLKRPFDIALSSIGILLSSPLWLLIALLVKLEDRGPVFYFQKRVGKNGRIFRAVKFRSMIRDAEKDRGPVQAVENDPRVTRVGRILRATAMDELPQLLNIFKGDMSFVGPRALRPEEKEVFGNPGAARIEDIPGYWKRKAVRPGLSGLAQVYLPTDAPRRRKFRYDALYIEKQSFCLDLKIIFLSFWITFRGKWESRQSKV